MLWKCHLKFYKIILNFKGKRTTSKEFLGVWRMASYCDSFWTFWPLVLWGPITFSFFICFSWSFSVLDVPKREFQFFLKHTNKGAHPWVLLGSEFWCVQKLIYLPKLQLKHLTHKLGVLLSYHTLYTQGVFPSANSKK